MRWLPEVLETLEEIGMRAQEDFVAAGGERLELVPSLNAHPAWVEAVIGLLEDALPPGARSRRSAEVEAEAASPPADA